MQIIYVYVNISEDTHIYIYMYIYTYTYVNYIYMIIYVYISILLFIRIHVCRYLPTVMPPFNSHSFTVTMQVTPQTPLQKATQLVNKVLKDVNECRTHGICLRVICGGHEP